MIITVSDDRKHLHFASKDLAETEALRCIFKHEDIKFERATGVNGDTVVVVSEQVDKAMKALTQWKNAMNGINTAMATIKSWRTY